MIRLLKIELKKILTYKTFWIILGLYFLFLALGIVLAEFMVNSMVADINKRMPIPFPKAVLYTFPDIWQNLTFFASIRFVLIFPAILIIILITNEFANKTIRQNIINGMSKTEFLVSKLQIIVLLSFVVTVILSVVIFMLGVTHTDMAGAGSVFRKFIFIPGFFVQMLTFLCFAFFFGFLLRNTGLAIALFTLYTVIIEPILYFLLKAPFMFENKIYTYLPVNSVISVVEYPSLPSLIKVMNFHLQTSVSLVSVLIPIGYSVIMLGIVFWVMQRKDL
jgi:ABC-type transport system involved in multi-copper enzyme maturation permease subunit